MRYRALRAEVRYAPRALRYTPLVPRLSRQPRVLGGPGSGNFGHAGRPGEVGGSAPGGGGAATRSSSPFADAPSDKKGARAWIKANAERYENDPEFRAVVDAITLHTQGDYALTYTATSFAETGEVPEKHKGADIEKDLNANSPMRGSPISEYTNYFPGQDVGKDSAGWADAGKALNQAVRDAAPLDQSLYRGLQGRQAFNNFAGLKPGEEMNITGVTSFTLDREVADKFASGRGPGQYRSRNDPKVIFRIEPGARGIKVGALSPYRQQEVITKGRFDVVSVNEGLSADRSSEELTVVLRQK